MAKRRNYQFRNGAEVKATRSMDDLAEFEDFKANILPALVKDIKAGMSPEQLTEKYLTYITGGLITTALSNPDVKARIAAAKDLIDRAKGKATERKEITHRLSELPDEELDAILLSEVDEISDEHEPKH